jgi:hypothetical protein
MHIIVKAPPFRVSNPDICPEFKNVHHKLS